MPTKTAKASATRFTLANLVAASKGSLLPAKKTVEGWEAWGFVSKFRDETGIVSGGYQKSGGQFVGLGIFGQGATWLEVGKVAMSIALSDEKKVASIMTRLGLDKKKSAWKKQVFNEGKLRFALVPYPDGQVLLRIDPAPDETQKKPRTRMIAVVVGRASVVGKKMKTVYARSLGVELSVFKKRFSDSIKVAVAETDIAKPKQNSMRGALSFQFGEETVLMVFGADKKNASQLLIDSTAREAKEFWVCVESTIAALKPRMSKSKREELLGELGKRKSGSLPRGRKEIDDGKHYISYSRAKDKCVLQIWPTHEKS